MSTQTPARTLNHAPTIRPSRRDRSIGRAAVQAGRRHPDEWVNGSTHPEAASKKAIIQTFERPKGSLTIALGNGNPMHDLHLASHKPVFSAEEVHSRYSLNIGALQAVIELPTREGVFGRGTEKQEFLYCFTQTISGGRHAKPEYVHYVIGQDTLNNMQAAVAAGTPVEEAMSGVIVLSQGGEESINVGRGAWLPGIGFNTRVLDTDPDLARQFTNTSRNQACVSVDPEGTLAITDLQSFNGTTVTCGPPVQAALQAGTGQFQQVSAW